MCSTILPLKNHVGAKTTQDAIIKSRHLIGICGKIFETTRRFRNVLIVCNTHCKSFSKFWHVQTVDSLIIGVESWRANLRSFQGTENPITLKSKHMHLQKTLHNSEKRRSQNSSNRFSNSPILGSQNAKFKIETLTLISLPTEANSLLAFWPNQYEPTLLNIWSIINRYTEYQFLQCEDEFTNIFTICEWFRVFDFISLTQVVPIQERERGPLIKGSLFFFLTPLFAGYG